MSRMTYSVNSHTNMAGRTVTTLWIYPPEPCPDFHGTRTFDSVEDSDTWVREVLYGKGDDDE